MSHQVLFVDDDRSVLTVLERQVGHEYSVLTAESGPKGLKLLNDRDQIEVVVSDYRMPQMDGIQFLAAAETIAPETVRIMLTGQGDMKVAVEAVNQGHLFRFLTKPCPTETLLQALEEAVEIYRVSTAERVLLEKTLGASVKVLTEILSLVNPASFGRSSRIKPLVHEIATWLDLPNIWEFELAAMLSQIGCVSVPHEILEKYYRGAPLKSAEKKMVTEHPEVGYDLVRRIPRLQNVAEMIRAQQKNFARRAGGVDFKSEDRGALGGNILKVALDFDSLMSQDISRRAALGNLRQGGAVGEMVDALEGFQYLFDKDLIKSVKVAALTTAMIIAEDVFTTDNVLLASRADRVSDAVIRRLKNFAMSTGVVEPIKVVMAADLAKAAEKARQ